MIDRLEHEGRLDAVSDAIGDATKPLTSETAGEVLRGRWLGHALHPLLTDFPLGCWLASGLLDLVGGRQARAASQRLVFLGLVFVPPTALAGLADYATLRQPSTRRVGAVHAIGNTVVAGSYFLSWRSRRAGHHLRGVGLGLLGGGLAWFTGYLGGHLSFARGASVEPRGLREPPEDAPTP